LRWEASQTVREANEHAQRQRTVEMISLATKHMELSHKHRPLLSETTCGVCFSGWLQCKIKNALCKLQKLVEPLCETHAPVHTSHIQQSLERFQKDVLVELYARGGYSEALDTAPTTTEEWKDWMDLAEAEMKSQSMLKHTATHWALLKGELTIWNRIGMAMAYGTTCPCCLGWRMILIGIIAFAAGRLA
jgi:hypothetical protein